MPEVLPGPLVMVHSDILKAYKALVFEGLIRPSSRLESRDTTVESVRSCLPLITGLPIENHVFPAFNYDFGVSRKFRVESDPVQVGSLPEHLRRVGALPRTSMPFFSFLGTGLLSHTKEYFLQPFGEGSGFDQVAKSDGYVLLFGVGVDKLTILHYAEHVLGMPTYRYDKTFRGWIESASASWACEVQMHVRPAGLGLDYDWNRLEGDFVSAGVMKAWGKTSEIHIIRVSDLLMFLREKVSRNPFYLLDEQTRDSLMHLGFDGRVRLEMSDFE